MEALRNRFMVLAIVYLCPNVSIVVSRLEFSKFQHHCVMVGILPNKRNKALFIDYRQTKGEIIIILIISK